MFGERAGLPSGLRRRAVTVVAAIATTLLAAAPSSAGPTARFPGAAWAGYNSTGAAGCARSSIWGMHWSRVTGDGGVNSSALAHTCVAYSTPKGSSSDASSLFEVDVPVHLPSGPGGVNLTWDLQARVSHRAVLNANLTCPTTTTSYRYYSGGVWYTLNLTKGDCEVDSYVALFESSYLSDLTTGAVYTSPTYFDRENATSILNYTYYETPCNPAVYSCNQSRWGTFYGSGPDLVGGSYRTTDFLNGTFNSTDAYVITTWLYLEVSAVVTNGWHGRGHAEGRIGLDGASAHADLRSLVIW